MSSEIPFEPEGVVAGEPEIETEIQQPADRFESWSEKGFGIIRRKNGLTLFCRAEALCDHLKALGPDLVNGVEETRLVGGKEVKRRVKVKVVVREEGVGEKGPAATEVCCEDHDAK